MKIKMKTLLVAALALGTASAARAADLAVDTLHGRYSIADAGQDVDNAEMHLRVLLNRPARGIFAPADVACESRVRSAVSLVGIEGRHPGLLRGEASGDWAQFREVRALFAEAEKIYGFYYYMLASRPKNGAAVFLDHATKARIGKQVDMADAGVPVDVAETSLRIILEKPAQGKLPTEMRRCSAKLEAAMQLLAVEIRMPGLLEGGYGWKWPQYDMVTALNRDLRTASDRYEFPKPPATPKARAVALPDVMLQFDSR